DAGIMAGIIVARLGAGGVPKEAAKAVPEGSAEAFALWPDADGRLWLLARSDAGLCQAVYEYLDQLGCRWYFPSERWMIVPKLDDIRIRGPVARKPAFAMRGFFGTGGFGGKLPLDPEMKLQARWTAWQRRNRFGGEFALSGHSGEAFNTTYKKV